MSYKRGGISQQDYTDVSRFRMLLWGCPNQHRYTTWHFRLPNMHRRGPVSRWCSRVIGSHCYMSMVWESPTVGSNSICCELSEVTSLIKQLTNRRIYHCLQIDHRSSISFSPCVGYQIMIWCCYCIRAHCWGMFMSSAGLLAVGDLGPNPRHQSRPHLRLGFLNVTFQGSEWLSNSL